MTTREHRVLQFQKAMSSAYGLSFSDPDYGHIKRVLELNMTMISEEYSELLEEFVQIMTHYDLGKTPHRDMLLNFVKELADLQYVVSQMANTFGINLEEAFNRVHLSNMSKLDDLGNPIRRADGKVMKGPNYVPPYMGGLYK